MKSVCSGALKPCRLGLSCKANECCDAAIGDLGVLTTHGTSPCFCIPDAGSARPGECLHKCKQVHSTFHHRGTQLTCSTIERHTFATQILFDKLFWFRKRVFRMLSEFPFITICRLSYLLAITCQTDAHSRRSWSVINVRFYRFRKGLCAIYFAKFTASSGHES